MNENRPNILIFMTDHQRADTVLPEKPVIMNNVKKLAEEGLIFENTYCPMAHCCPARATFFTGLYPTRSGVWNNVCNGQALSLGLKDGIETFGEVLKKSGYNLSYSGKWHVSVEESPADRGWKELMVSSVKGTHHGKSWGKIEENASISYEEERKPGEMILKGYGNDILYGTCESNKHDDEATQKAVDEIEKLGKEEKPWAMYVGPNMPHAPYTVPQKYLDMYDINDIELPKNYYDDLKDKPNYYRKLKEMTFGQLSEIEVREAIRHFYAMCTYLDELFGKLMDKLDKTGQADNTLVLYCSDHGDYLGEHGLFHKGVPAFLGAYNVPAVVRWPNGIKNSGRRVKELVSLADFAPTFMELAGVKPSEDLTGKSLVPFLKDIKPLNWRDMMFTQCNGVENYFTQRMAFNKEYKYVYNGFDFDELYDLKNDPYEMVNIINDSKYEDIKHTLVKRMWDFAHKENDPLATAGGYIMVGTAPYGPSDIFK